MGGRKTTITFDDDVYDDLAEQAKAMGFTRVSSFVKFLTTTRKATTSLQVLHVPVKNYGEIEGYVTQKKFGSVESFATFAMEQYMCRVPLTEGQRRRIEQGDE